MKFETVQEEFPVKTKPTSRFKHLAIAGAVTAALVSAQLLSLPQNALAVSNPVVSAESGIQYGPPSFATLAEQVKPAVVSIAITGKTNVMAGMPGQGFKMPQFPEGTPFGEFFKHFYDGQRGMPGEDNGAEQEFQAVGSGFVISEDGYVVTNNHVVENAEEINVVMQDGTQYEATIKGVDPKTDLALLKVKADKPLPYVELGDSDRAKVGEWVVAVGNPFGLGGTVTAGIVSARGRDIHSGPFDDFIQIDAPINRGNSGGPLFDNQGRVIGVNTAIYSPTGGNVGIGFAIPSNMAKDIIADLKANGKVARGWLGVQIQPVTEEIAESLDLKEKHGALVAGVEPGSPAEHAGIKRGDVIVSMNGEKLDDFKDLPRLVAKAKAGNESTFEVERQGKTRNIEVKIGSMPSDDVKVALANDAKNDDTPKLGVYLAELTPEARQRFRIDKDTEGVLVAGVQNGSPASKAGIRAGSVINMVGQDTVKSPQDVIAKVKEAAKEKKSSVLLMVEQDGAQRFVAVKFAKA